MGVFKMLIKNPSLAPLAEISQLFVNRKRLKSDSFFLFFISLALHILISCCAPNPFIPPSSPALLSPLSSSRSKSALVCN